MSVAEMVQQRRSVKEFDPTVQVAESEWRSWLELAKTAPSSWNLQHGRYAVITEPEQKQRLAPIAYNQPQITTASVVVVICGDCEAHRIAERVYQPAVAAGAMAAPTADKIVQQIRSSYQASATAQREALVNASLAAMQLMLVVQERGFDSCAMGGFMVKKLSEEFSIPDRYLPVMLIAIGKACKPPRYVTERLPLEELLIPLR